MASFPTLYSSTIALYPVTRTAHRGVQVLEFTNFTEQRWKNGAPLEAFTLQFSDMPLADMLTLRAFFDARKGGFDSTWDLTLGGVTYSNMVFESDSFDSVERFGGYSVTLTAKQVKA